MERFVRVLIFASLMATIGSSLRTYPHQLAYFNELAGGSTNGHRHLLHSNLDWGQDLLFVKEWYLKHGNGAPLYFTFYKYGNPTDIGLPVTSPQIVRHAEDDASAILAGIHIVSMTCLHGGEAYFVSPNGLRQRVSARDVAPYRLMKPVFKGGYSLLVFSVPVGGD